MFVLAGVVCLLAGSSGGPQPLRAQDKPNPKSVIRGTVRDQQNSLYGILVTAKPEGKNTTTTVFTDEHGDYAFPPLAPGNYTVSVGTKWQEKVTLDSAPVKQDFAVELGPGFFNQTSGGSVLSVLPGTDGEKKNIVNNCGSCHSIWRVFDHAQPSPDAWTTLVRRMGLKKGGPGSLDETVAPRVDMSDKNFHTLVSYYSANVTPSLKQSHVVEEMFRPRGEGARAVFTEWSLPKELGGIATAKPDSKGMIWFPSGQKGALGRLDPRTGEVKTWPAPVGEMLKGEEPPLHDIMIDKDDNVWLTGGGKNVVLKFDSKTLQFTKWDIPEEYGLKPHTGELDRDGNFWVTMQTGKPGKGWINKLDTHTGKVTGFPTKASYPHPYGPEPYGLVIDAKGTIWFTELFGGKLGKIDPKTGEMTEYSTPNPDAGPRRLTLDSKGNLWFTECFVGKIGEFDPATMKFMDYDLGVSGGGFPYSIRIDKSDQVWFSMNSNNSIGKLDPATKKVTYSLFPVPESTTIDPGFDFSGDPVTLVYGTHRAAVGRVYFRP
jgi:virginiamycin B lyase